MGRYRAREPWSGPPRRTRVNLQIYDLDPSLIWRRRSEVGRLHFGVLRNDAPTIQDVADRSDLFRRRDDAGKVVPIEGFDWLKDPVNKRTVSVHGILCQGDTDRNYGWVKNYGVWTSGGFYSLHNKSIVGYTNPFLERLANGDGYCVVKPTSVSRFITTRWGYVVPITTYHMVQEYLNCGDLETAYRRAVPSWKVPKDREKMMSKVRRTFNSPAFRHHLAHELKDAIEDRGLTVGWIAEQIERAIDESRGEKKIAGLKFLMEVHEASAVAEAQATGIIPAGDLTAAIDVLPQDRGPRQFTRSEISTYMSTQDN